ncbi:MAG: MEDS domain-containing protein [Candidatus Sulfotelmatobacter sp.]
MANQLAPVIGEKLGLGDDVAFFFKSNEERLNFVIPYMIDGLRNQERCVYVAEENTVPEILAEFMKAGIYIDAATASGALSVVTKHDTYLRHGIFDPAGMIADLDRDVRFALQQGFSGLRVTGEMSWALDLPSALGRLCEYEQELYRRWPAQLAGLCQYDESLFSPDVIAKMANCHCAVVRDGNIVRQHTHRSEDTLSA